MTLRQLIVPAIATASLLAVLAGTQSGFIGAQDDGDASPPVSLQDRQEEILQDNAKPRFDGELLGIHLGPASSLSERGILFRADEECPGGYEVSENEPSIPGVPSYLPKGAVQPLVAPGGLRDYPNPSALVCAGDGFVYRSVRRFEMPHLENGLTPSIDVARANSDHHVIDAPHERVSVIDLGGREAIAIPGVIPEGGTVASLSQVIIPEESGYLLVYGIGVSFDEVLRVASVAK